MPVKSLKRIGKGPFKGPTPKKVFQTIDLGSGREASYLYGQAKKNSKRKYLAIDTEGIILGGRPAGHPRFLKPYQRIPKNLKVSMKDSLLKLQELHRLGVRSRHVQISMPSGRIFSREYLQNIAKSAAKVLLPNGKVHFLSPLEPERFEGIAEAFKLEGFSFRVAKTPENSTQHSFAKYSPKAAAWFEQYGFVPWQYEFTLGLKKAIPGKAKRRNWPR